MGAEGGQAIASAIRMHPNFAQIAQNMFGGETKVDMSKKNLDAGDAFIIAAALEKNEAVTELDARNNSLDAESKSALRASVRAGVQITV